MRTVSRRQWSYASLLLLLVADVAVLLALILDQWLATTPPVTWLLAGALTAAVMPALLRLADKVFAWSRASRNIPFAGESFP